MILTGLPDMGKSNISISIAAAISTGGKWPDGTDAPRGKVLILSSEDAPSDTIVPRIIAAGGDRSMIGFLQQRTGVKGKSRMITLKEDLEAMGAAVKRMGNVSLVIVDPVTGYMGNGVDTHKAADVRAVLDGVSLWAIEHDLAVLAITHPAKAVTSAMNSMVGSQAYVAFFRSAFMAGWHPDDDDKPKKEKRRIFAPIKGNLAEEPPESVSYNLLAKDIGDGIRAPYVEWCEVVEISADQIVKGNTAETKSDAAEKFLKSLWDFDNSVELPVKQIEEMAKAKNLSWRTIERAKATLPIQANKMAHGWAWIWRP